MYKKIMLWGILCVMLGLAAYAMLRNYQDTHPEFAFSATMEECRRWGAMDGVSPYSIQPEVMAMAMARGISEERAKYVVAVRGHELIGLEPYRFHAVYCRVNLKKIDANTVNFYFYHPRYQPTFGG